MTFAPPAASPASTRLGTVIGDRYRLVELLGRGGFGEIYKAFHLGTHEHVALKILRTDVSTEPGAVERFTAEARMSASLHHPNTVRVFDFGQTPDGALYLAMEFLSGDTLEELLQAQGRLSPRRAVRIAVQVCKSLAEAHGKHIVHRDLKPDNIFVGEAAGEPDFVRVIDFGIAKFLGGSQNLTVSGAILGTPHVMSPEQIHGEMVDERSDLYALGVVLYRCLTGRYPCDGDTSFAILASHLTEPPPAMASLVPDLDPALEAVVLLALVKEREARYPDAEAMRAALDAWLANAPLDPPLEPQPKPVDVPDATPMVAGVTFDPQDFSATQAMDALVLPVPTSDDTATQALSIVTVALPEPAELPPEPPPAPPPVEPDDAATQSFDVVVVPERKPLPPRTRPASQSQPPVDVAAPDKASGRGLQRRAGTRKSDAMVPADDTATQAMPLVQVEQLSTTREVLPPEVPRPAPPVKAPSKTWLAWIVLAMIVVGAAIGALLAAHSRASRRAVAPAPAPVAAPRSP